MNISKIYSEAIDKDSSEKETLLTDEQQKQLIEEEKEKQENIEILALNWRIHPITKQLFEAIRNKITQLTLENLNLAGSSNPNKYNKIESNLIEIRTINKILNYGSENNFTI